MAKRPSSKSPVSGRRQSGLPGGSRFARRLYGLLCCSLAVTMLTAPSRMPAADAADAARHGGRPHAQQVWQPRPVVKEASTPARGPKAAGRRGSVTSLSSERQVPVAWPAAADVALVLGASPAPAAPRVPPRSALGDDHAAAVPALPVTITETGASAATGTGSAAQPSVHLSIAGHAAATAAGVTGLIASVSRTDGGASPVGARVSMDYSSFVDAFGGNFSDRLRLEVLPACALTTPKVAACRIGKPLAYTNEPSRHQLTATVSLGAKTTTASGIASSTLVLAATSTSTGPNGSYSATPLKASDSWTSGGNSGSFGWSYPLKMPPSLGGSAPSVSLDYDSSSVDGRTTAANSQPSDIGEGWDISGSGEYIETVYKPCAQVNPTNWAASGDMCLGVANATIGGGAHAGQLVRDDADTTAPGGKWRLANDDGTRVQLLHGTEGGTNGTSNSAYWQLTDTDGTVYLYGANRLPQAFGGTGADAATYSAWSVPVFGTGAGTTCNDPTGTEAPQACKQAWRWNLDFKIDPNGNVTRYDYAREEDFYQRTAGVTGTTEFTRSGFLREIDYGWRTAQVAKSTGYLADGTAAGPLPAATAQFEQSPRCDTGNSLCPINHGIGVSVNAASGTANSGITSANKAAFPDVPYDQHCDSGSTTCTQYSPTFYSSVETAGVLTAVNAGASTGSQPAYTPAGYRAVDSYLFPQAFPLPQDNATSGNRPELWLNGIKHTGYITNSDGTQTGTAAPEVLFGSTQLPNRSAVSSLYQQAQFYRFRVNQIADELGGDTVVSYSKPGSLDCGTTAPPATTANATLCYPEYYAPASGSPTPDWFNKYLLTGVTTHDNTTTGTGYVYSRDHATAYTYIGTPAWHTNDSEQVDSRYRTVDGFRGFSQVQTVTGTEAAGSNSKTLTSFFRGMDQDPTGYVCLNDSHSQAPASTACPSGGYRDDNVLAGQAYETRSYASDTSSTVVNDAITVPQDPTDQGMVTAVHARASGLPQQRAHFNHVQKQITYSQVSTSATPRRTEIDYTYGNDLPDFANDGVGWNGALIWTDDKGETDAAGNPLRLPGEPELCTWLGYASNTNPALGTAALQWTAYPNEKITWTVLAGQSCTANQETSATITSHVRTLYDGQAFPGLANGNVTATQTWPTAAGTPITSSSIGGYDAYGRPGSATDADGHTTTTQYFPATGLLPTQVKNSNAMGWTSTVTLDRGRVVTLTNVDVNGRQTDAVYDGLGRIIEGWNADHTKAANPTTPNVQYTYSLPGTTLSTSASPNAYVETQTLREDDSYAAAFAILDGFGEQIEAQSTPPDDGPGLLSTQAEYNSLGKAWRTAAVHYDGGDSPSGAFIPYGDALPSETVTTYDGMSRPLTVGQYAGSSVTPIPGMVTTYAYPGLDRTDANQPSGGTATSTFTDARGRTTALWTYHENPPARPGDPTDADKVDYGLSFPGNGTTVTTVSDVIDGSSAQDTWTTTINDLLGHDITKTDPDTGTSNTIEDAAGLLRQSTDGRGKTLSYQYDALNRRTAQYAAPWSANPDPATELASWSYDSAGSSDGKTSLGLGASSTRYTQGGNQPGYVSTVTGYDPAGRPLGTSVTIPALDGNGALAGTYTTAATYTPVTGLLDHTDLPAGGGLPSETVYNSYNVSGLLLATGGNANYLVGTQYDHDGKILSRTLGDYPHQVVEQNIFDAATNRVTNQFIDATAGRSSANPSQLNTYAVDYGSYTYDAAGLLTSAADLQNYSTSGSYQPGAQAKDLQCYTYDYADRLTNAWADNGDQNPPSATTFNAASPMPGGLGTCKSSTGNNPPTASNLGGPAPYWQSYTFDAANTPGLGNGAQTGSRSTLIDHDVTGKAANDITRTSAFPAAGTMNTAGPDPSAGGPGTSGTGPHLLQKVAASGGSTGADTYTYDGAGNTTGRKLASGDSQTLTWDAEEHLASVTDSANKTTTSFVYDTSGNTLIRRDYTSGTANGTITAYLGYEEIHLKTSSGALSADRYYTYPGAPTIVSGSDGSLTYEIGNSQGTAGTAVNAANGQILARRFFKPYGDPRGAAPAAWPDDHTFLGKSTDAPTGLVDVGAREYDAAIGRFISADPQFQAGSPQTIGGYAYAGDDPVSAADPSGLGMPAATFGDGGTTPVVQGQPMHQISPHVWVSEKSKYFLKFYEEWANNIQTKKDGTLDEAGTWFRACARDAHCMEIGLWVASDDLDPKAVYPATAIDVVEMMKQDHVIELSETGNVIDRTAGLQAQMGMSGLEVGPKVGELGPELMAFAKGIQESLADDGQLDAGPSCSAGHSFAAGTEVLMADGTKKPIQDVAVGDQIENAQPGGAVERHRVDEIHKTLTDKDFTDLTVASARGPRTITGTQNHPYYDLTAGAFVDASRLKPGDRLQTDSSATVTVLTVRNYSSTMVTYDLTIDGLHTYYVVAGDTPVLVHNSSCPAAIALGLTSTDDNDMSLADFADSTGAKMFTDWPKDKNWKTVVTEALDPKGTTEIHFNLDGIDDPDALAKSQAGVTDPEMGDFTAWELAQIKAAPASVQRRVTWYSNGKVVPSPFGE